jgi:hypothetical protein
VSFFGGCRWGNVGRGEGREVVEGKVVGVGRGKKDGCPGCELFG